MTIDVNTASREELASFAIASQAKIAELLKLEQEQKFRIQWLERQVFGQKTEKLLPQDSHQTTLFDIPEALPSEKDTVKQYERDVRKKPTEQDKHPLRFDESVPIDEEVVLPVEVEGLSEEEYEVIGEKVTTRLVQVPTQYRVKRTVRKIVKLKGKLHTAPAPDAVVERSFADVSLLAGMITDKFQYHLPLYRQHQRMRNSGVNVSRSQLTKLTHRSLELLEPIYYSILSSVVTSEFVSMDETPIKASRKEKGKMNTAYFWPVFANNQVAFVYSSSRGHKVVSEVLGRGCKKLLSDGYSAYESYAKARGDLIHAQCWAHARRKFFEAKEHSPPECEQVLSYIQELFEIEASVQGKDEVDILVARRLQSLPLLDKLFSYIGSLWFEAGVDKTSLLGKAVTYTRKREQALRVFLEHPEIPLSNNHVERVIRPVALGRKNWLFAWSEVGAKYSAIAYTLIESCKMQKVNPWHYLVDVMQRIDSHPARDVHLLTPIEWKKNFATNE